MHASDLIDILRKRGRFTDTIIDGEIYNAVKLKAYMPSLKENINIVFNVRAETKDIRILCPELDKDIVTIIRYALKRMKIENFYRDTKQLGFGERTGLEGAKRALIHAHLVFLAYILLEILRHRLISFQDNQDNAINGVCYNMGQEESKTWVCSLHM